MSETLYSLKRQELWRLLFWASYGVGMAIGGTALEETEQLINKLAKENKLQITKAKIGRWREERPRRRHP